MWHRVNSTPSQPTEMTNDTVAPCAPRECECRPHAPFDSDGSKIVQISSALVSIGPQRPIHVLCATLRALRERCVSVWPVQAVVTATVSKRSRMRKKSAVGAVRRTMCVLRYRAAARAPLLHAVHTHRHPLSAPAVQEQRSSCPLVPFSPRSAAVQALDANAGVTANAWQMPCW